MSKPLKSIVVRLSQAENIALILVTPVTLQPLRSSVVSLLQPLNICDTPLVDSLGLGEDTTTPATLQPLKSSSVKLLQPANIW